MLYLLCLLPLVPLAQAQQCSLVSVSGCQPDPSEVIKTYIIPGEPTSMCQQLCTDTDQCNLWSYDSGSSICSLLHSSYLATCDNITAGAEPDYTQCLAQDSGTCDDIVQENCDLQGNALWQSKVSHAYECQEYLQLLGAVLGGSVFSYSHTSSTCTILDTGARHCSKVSGPRQPSLDECKDATTTASEVSTNAPATTSAPADGDGM